MTDMKFNFRSSSGFVTDGAGETFFGGGAYSGGVGYGMVGGPPDASFQDREVLMDRRLAGIMFIGNDAGGVVTFRADIGNGNFLVNLALGDALSALANLQVKIFDGASGTPLLTVAGSTSAGARWFDASGVERNEAGWIASAVAMPITITNGYARVELGHSSAVSDYSTLAHLAFVADAGGGGSFQAAWARNANMVVQNR